MTKAILRPTLLAIAFIAVVSAMSDPLMAQAPQPDPEYAKCALHGRIFVSQHFNYCVDFISAKWRPTESSRDRLERMMYSHARYERLLDLSTVVTTADRVNDKVSDQTAVSYFSQELSLIKSTIDRLCSAQNCKDAPFLGFPRGMRKDANAFLAFVIINASASIDSQRTDSIDLKYRLRLRAMERAIDMLLHPSLIDETQIASR